MFLEPERRALKPCAAPSKEPLRDVLGNPRLGKGAGGAVLQCDRLRLSHLWNLPQHRCTKESGVGTARRTKQLTNVSKCEAKGPERARSGFPELPMGFRKNRQKEQIG